MMENAKWIACDKDAVSPIIKKTFWLESPISGGIDITGLGFFTLYFNGKRVGADYLVPAQSEYHERDLSVLTYPLSDTFSTRIYYLHYDLSSYLCDGENTIEIMLGNGWYRQYERTSEGEMSFGDELLAIFEVELLCESGKHIISSDGGETYSSSHITFSNIFMGEKQDTRLIGKAEERQVKVIPAPNSPLVLQSCPTDKIMRNIKPQRLQGGVYDAGENISGFAVVHACGTAGERLTVRYAEELDENGTLNFDSAGGSEQIQNDTFICDGTPRDFAPHFAIHGFRYFDIEGDFDDLSVAVVHADIAVTSSFNSDNETLNWLYDAYIRTQLCNMHGGVPTDCPHRERLGYTGDGQVTADSAMLLLDSKSFYEKWIYDIWDCQDIHSGHVQHTAPFMGGGGGPGGWGGAIVMVPYAYYKHFGEREFLRQCYLHMKKWVSYMRSRSEDYIITREEEGGWCLGDWAAMGGMQISSEYVNTCLFVKALQKMQEIAAVLGEADEFEYLISKTKSAITAKYFDNNTGSFADGVQGADAFAVDIGLDSDRRTLANLVEKYSDLNCFDTGFIGTDILIDVLCKNANVQLAFALLTSDKKGSYNWQMQKGATTMWEYFDGGGSHSHPMFGAPVRHLFSTFLGINISENGIKIAPFIPSGLACASGKVGNISVSFEKGENSIEFVVNIPDNTAAIFEFGGKTLDLHSGENRFVFSI